MLKSKMHPLTRARGLKEWTNSANPTSSTLISSPPSRKVCEPKVDLGELRLAPARYYMERIPTKRGDHTFVLGRDKFPKQWVLVLNRIRMSNSWMVLVLVNGMLRWEHEIDALLWKRSE